MTKPTSHDDLTVCRIGRHVAATNGQRIALDDGAERVSYAELERRVHALASTLLRLGVQRGEVVSAFLPNCIEYVVTVLAVARAGAVFSPLNPRFKAGELSAILRQSRPRVVVVEQALAETLAASLSAAEHDAYRVVTGNPAQVTCNACRWHEALAGPLLELPRVAEDDHFSLMFTSGTTGVPKGALASHRARMVWVLNACILYSLSEDDVYLGTMPQVHSAGLTFTLMHLYVGGTVHILRDFSADGYLDLLARQRVTSSLVVPTMVVMTLEELRRREASPDLSALRRLVTCGSPLQEATKNEVLERITENLYDYYGSTESNSMTVLKPRDQRRKSRSVGQPFQNVSIRIEDENGEETAPGVAGDVLCRNPSLMDRYLDNPEATAAAFRDGWYRTGDLGYLDEEGYLYLVGRKNDVIISGGVNIYPAEIENTLMSHPDVLDVAVLGAPDEKWGQCVCAYVVPRQGSTVELESLQAHCKHLLADYKKPRRLHLVAALPKNAGGKTVKSKLA